MKGQIPQREIEYLSAYLDQQLDKRHQAQLEERLRKDPELQAILRDLGQARLALKSLPRVRAPRNFTLKPEMVSIRRTPRRIYPAFGWASVLASILLVLALVGDFLGLSSLTSSGLKGEAGATVVAMQQSVEMVTTQEVYLKEAAPGVAQESEAALPTEAAAVAEDTTRMAAPSTEPTLEFLAMATPELTEEPLVGSSEGTYPPPSDLMTVSGTSPITPTQPMDATQGRNGSGSTETATPEPLPTEMPLAIAPQPTDTPLPTNTSFPTSTPEPTATPPLEEEIVPTGESAVPTTAGIVEEQPPAVLRNFATPEPVSHEPIPPLRILEIILGLVAVSTGLAAWLLSRRSGR
jgi:hypothetical protein